MTGTMQIPKETAKTAEACNAMHPAGKGGGGGGGNSEDVDVLYSVDNQVKSSQVIGGRESAAMAKRQR